MGEIIEWFEWGNSPYATSATMKNELKRYEAKYRDDPSYENGEIIKAIKRRLSSRMIYERMRKKPSKWVKVYE